jgi:hypothetical protein
MNKLLIACVPLFLGVTACERPESEFIEALPDRDTVILDVPEDGQQQNELRARISKQTSELVGAPAEWYSNTYYTARDLNTLAGFVVTLLETITGYPATEVSKERAVWGPFSDDKEPNEFTLTIEKDTADDVHFTWAIRGKHKSHGDDKYVSLAAGAFAPAEKEDQGRGWFVIDFDNIHQLNPAEDGRGRIAYALEKSDAGTLVLAHFKGVDENGNNIKASYAYGEDTNATGFIVFRLPVDIDDGEEGKTAAEEVLIRTRFTIDGGRADIFATHGDLGTGVVIGSQCWDEVFTSTFEQFKLGDDVLAAAGDEKTCAFGQAETPAENALPEADEVESPYTLAELMR